MNLKRRSAPWIAIIAMVMACSRLYPPDPQKTLTTNAVPILRQLSEEMPKCLSLVKAFCENLFSAEYRGSLSIELPEQTFEIRRGRTKNDFSQVYFEYAQTQLRHRHRLPGDFLQALNKNLYFKKLTEYLGRKPLALMTLDERVEAVRLSSEIEAIWTVGLNQTVLKRMEKQYDGFSRIPDELMPVEIRNESGRVRRILLSEIARAIWTDHPNWKRVQRQFKEVQKTYRQILSTLPGIPDALRSKWSKRISEVRLVLPGADPEVDMLACGRTEDNAYYYSYRNYVTVCAGDFNAENMLQTLAHELAHALDVDRQWILYEQESKFGKELGQLFDSTCSDEKFSCKRWEKMKSHFPQLVATLDGFEPDLVDFNRCLKGKETKHPVPEAYMERFARDETRETVADLAENNVFLKLVTPVLPMVDGTFQKNPMYLNPCAYYLWNRPSHPFDETLTTLLFFVAEYRCTEELTQEERFRRSIDLATSLQKTVTIARIRGEGEFSGRRRLVADGYSASPSERFADTLAGLVLSKMLSSEKDVARRRAQYLTNTTWSCPRPSIQRLLPDVARVQEQYLVRRYSDDFERQRELLSSPIREVLACEKDFEIRECKLTEAVPASVPEP